MTENKETTVAVKAPEPKKKAVVKRYEKRAFLESPDFKSDRDILSGLLEDDQTYTVDEVNRMVQKRKELEVK